jgi:hypothetical protein
MSARDSALYDRSNAVVVTPLDAYQTTRRECERHLAQLLSYRESCARSSEAAYAELQRVVSAIDELETLLQLKARPEARS